MRFTKYVLGPALAAGLTLAVWSLGASPKPKPLSEADVLKLVELMVDDPAIVARVEKAGLNFRADDAVIERLKKAGASDTVLAALRKAGVPAVPAEAEPPFTPRERLTFTPDLKSAGQALLSPDNKTVAIGSEKQVELWDATTGKKKAALPELPERFFRWTFSPDSRMLALGFVNYIRLFDVDTGKELHPIKGTYYETWLLRFSPDSKTITCMAGSAITLPFLTVWNVETGELLHKGGMGGGAWYVPPSGKAIYVLDGENTRMIDLDTLERRPVKRVSNLYCLPDGKTACLVEGDTITLIDVATAKEVSHYQLPGARFQLDPSATQCAISPDRKFFAGKVDGQKVELWDVPGKRKITTLEEPIGSVAILFSGDSKTLVTYGDRGNAIKLWDAATGEKRATLLHGSQGPLYVELSPDGRTMVSRSDDDAVKVWDIATAKELGSLKGQGGGVVGTAPDLTIYSHAVMNDGKVRVILNKDGTVTVWDVAK